MTNRTIITIDGGSAEYWRQRKHGFHLIREAERAAKRLASAPLYIAIGADPTRAVPDPGSEEEAAIAGTDLILLPTCPLTAANVMLHDLYASAMTKHTRIKLDACYDAFVHPRFEEALD